MGQDSSYVLKDLLLLGNKTYTPKAFSLSEIVENNYKDGYYKEGILEEEIQFQLQIECSEPTSTNLYQLYSQGAIWDINNNPITNLSLICHNAYLNNDNTGNIMSSRICQDMQGYLYEFLTFNGIKNLNVNYFKPGGYFGPPMSSKSTYLYCADWSTKDDTEGKHKVTIQTNNPNVKAIAISFVPPTVWSTTFYTSRKIKINNEYILNFENNNDVLECERTQDYKGIKYCSRYIIVKDNNELKIFKSWILDKNYTDELEYNIWLKGRVFGEMKSFSIDELLGENSFDGTFDDIKETHFKLDLLFKQKWTTFNSGEIVTSGALVWDINNNIYNSYELGVKKQTSDSTFEVIYGKDNLIKIIIINDKFPQTTNYYFINNFGKNVSYAHNCNTAGKIIPVMSISVLGGIDKEMNSSIYFFSKKFKAFALDVISIYDYKYNGANNSKNRHVGYLKSNTHDNILCKAESSEDWVNKYTIVINNIVYSARCIFTTTKSFLVYTDITNTKYLEIDTTLYIYMILTNEMVPYSLDECIELDFEDRLFEGKYIYDITPVQSSLFKLSKTFNTDKIGVNKLLLIDESYQVINVSRLGKNMVTDNSYLYKINSDNLLDNDNLLSDIFLEKGILSVDNNINFDLVTDNPDCNIYGIIAWYNFIEEIQNNNAGKLEINGITVYNYTNNANFTANEFKMIDSDIYGSLYFYIKKENKIKKAWVKISDNNIDYSKYYLIATEKNIPLSLSIEEIIKDERNDGYTDRSLTYSNKFSVQIVSGGSYGGAIYRVYPVINDQIYVGAAYTTSNAASGTVKVWIKPSGIQCKYKEDKINFLNIAKGLDSRTEGVKYNTAVSSYILNDDELELTCTFSGKYNNNAYYQPAYIVGQTESSNSNTYFLGLNTSTTRLCTFTITDKGDAVKDFLIQGLFIIPYYLGPTSNRCATRFKFKTYDTDKLLTDDDISASTYRGWYVSVPEQKTTEIV